MNGAEASELRALTLDDWRRARGLNYAELGALLGVTDTTAWAYCIPRNHKRAITPRRRLMEKINEVTAGAVDPNSFFAAPAQEAA